MEENKKLDLYIISFLREYQTLCQKYKMGLRGCGCCRSPYIQIGDKAEYDINYDYETDKIKIYNGKERTSTDLDIYIEEFLENHKEYKDEQEIDKYLEGMLKNE